MLRLMTINWEYLLSEILDIANTSLFSIFPNHATYLNGIHITVCKYHVDAYSMYIYIRGSS